MASVPNTSVRFADIQAILNRVTAGRSKEGMQSAHSAANFGWDTLDQLKSVVVRPDGQFGNAYPLIDMALVQQGRGADTNLVQALRNASGVDSYGRMPFGGPYVSPDEIQQIIDWLNAGLPE